MKTLMETFAGILWTAAILAMVFVFSGNPNLWDKWHDLAMKNTECKH